MVLLLKNFFHFHLFKIKILLFICLYFPHNLAAKNQYYNPPETAANVQCLDFTEQLKILIDKLKDLEASQRTTGQNSHAQKEQNECEENPDSPQLVEEQLSECKESLKKALHNAEQLSECKENLESAQYDAEQLSECKENLESAQHYAKQLSECKESLESAQRNAEQLSECKESLENAQRNAAQLDECKESLSSCKQDLLKLSKCSENKTNSRTEMNKLRRLVLERYTPADVVTAARENNMDRLRLLLDAGMSVNSQDPSYYGNTPLHVAAHTGRLEMIRFLVGRGAILEARNADNNTPFIDTAVGGSIPAAELLIELGANPNARGWHGETARDRAIRQGHTAIANWYRDHGW